MLVENVCQELKNNINVHNYSYKVDSDRSPIVNLQPCAPRRTDFNSELKILLKESRYLLKKPVLYKTDEIWYIEDDIDS